MLSSDLTIHGNVRTSGDIQVEGIVEGDIRAQMLIVGESATVKGEVIAEEVVVHGRVVGRLRGLKVRLSTSARCEGDIIHKTIAIESGAHFEGSVQRQDDPLGKGKEQGRAPARRPGDDRRRVAPAAASGDFHDRSPAPRPRGAGLRLSAPRGHGQEALAKADWSDV